MILKSHTQHTHVFRISSSLYLSLHLYLYLFVLSLDITSWYVCVPCFYVYTDDHTHTHTRSLFMSLSRLSMFVIERGTDPSLSMCCVGIEKGRRVLWVYPGTPGISVETICHTVSDCVYTHVLSLTHTIWEKERSKSNRISPLPGKYTIIFMSSGRLFRTRHMMEQKKNPKCHEARGEKTWCEPMEKNVVCLL